VYRRNAGGDDRLPERVVHAVPADEPEAVQVPNRPGVDRSTALSPVIEQVRRLRADERWPGAQRPRPKGLLAEYEAGGWVGELARI
jgi:hypothetical protein